jgi:hypothetical protein
MTDRGDKIGAITDVPGLDVRPEPEEGSYAVVFLGPISVEGYGGYRRGDVATFGKLVADALRKSGVARKYVEGMKIPEQRPGMVIVGSKALRTTIAR